MWAHYQQIQKIAQKAIAVTAACMFGCHALAGDLMTRDTLTGNWFGAGEALEEHGIAIGLGLTEVYQYNLEGGLQDDIGRQSGSYDLELGLDLETLIGIPGGTLFMLGSWQGGMGFDAVAVGSIFGVNDDGGGERTLDITELWYQQNLLNDRLRIRLGKLDLTGGFECQGCPVSFDGNRFANDETAQFMNGALVNNPSIPFPDNGLGVMIYAEPVDGWYIGLGAADAEADARESGFSTVADGDSKYFYIAETGLVKTCESANGPLTGVYRVGIWSDHGPKEHLDGSGARANDTGFYLSVDQDIYRENAEDDQGLSLFARFGWANRDINAITHFYSAGGQYKGLLPGRESDVLGLGVAHGELSGDASFTADHERVVECYYNIEIAPWIQVSPSLQWVENPGGTNAVNDAVIAGVRAQIAF